MFDPEAADTLVAMGQGEAVGGLRVREERGVEVQTDAQLGRPVHPPLEMRQRDLVPLHPLAAVFQVNGVQAESVLAGDEAESLGGVGAEFVGVAGAAGVVAGGENPAAA